MIDSEMKSLIQGRICSEVRILKEREERYRLFLPFFLTDGDGFSIVLKKTSSGRWLLTDEASTLMHAGIWLPDNAFEKGKRSKVLEGLSGRLGVQNRNGELIKRVESVEDIGQAVFEFVQALLRVTDTDMLSRDYTPSTFRDDFESFIAQTLPTWCYKQPWHHDELDPEHMYTVDTWVKTKTDPLLIFALNTDDRVRDATITIQHYQKREYDHKSVGVYDTTEGKNSKAQRRFRAVSDGQYTFETQSEDFARLLLERADPMEE